ncbi:hypothetical protein B5P45_22595 [Phyllobacterium zundukense]|uniref:Uncharacterized protein n=1 Tax=Phyllobacterium zundukense TaxID=1867719 RepID=A0A2N9VQV1_9HYPH|nr:hypothetical protein B5P45_22595 [Phyllobacterium zundukense]
MIFGYLYPPLPCRASPPQGGRSAFIDVSANQYRWRLSGYNSAILISPLVGEMGGSPEGGVIRSPLWRLA